MIQSKNLSFSYQNGEGASLVDVNLTIALGECVVLTGKSGSGKTTFTRMLNGLCPVFFHGELTGSCVCSGLSAGEAAIEDYVTKVGSVFQNPKTQYFNTNTTAELAFPCENVGMASSEIVKKVADCAKAFHMEHLLDRSIFHLSGGEKQRIACACATMLNPQVLVLDEPSSNLDSNAMEQLREMLLQMKAMGMTLVLAEHRLAWLSGVADRYYLFEESKISAHWTAAEFMALSSDTLANLGLRTNDLTLAKAKTKEKELIHPQGKAPLLQAKALRVGYGKKQPVYQVEDFALYSGEIVGLMGHNGVGKSTLAKTLCGLQNPLSGDILWKGTPQKGKNLTKHAFLVMQDVNYQLFADSVEEEVLLGATEKEKCAEVLELLSLTSFAQRHPMSLSGGQKQRVAIASAMLSGKELIVLDEPTSGLDYYHMMQVGRLLEELKRQGKAVLVITHDEELTAQVCDRVIRLGE